MLMLIKMFSFISTGSHVEKRIYLPGDELRDKYTKCLLQFVTRSLSGVFVYNFGHCLYL